MEFFLGTHHPHWLGREDIGVPLFVSRRNLFERKTLPRAVASWALDSGAFTELNRGAWTLRTRDAWTVTVAEYAREIERYRDEIGRLVWVAPMDYPCEPQVVWKNGLSVAEHQRRTIENFLDLRERAGAIVAPVLQGWWVEEYLDHVEQYRRAGVDLVNEPRVGVGSICRRGADSAIIRIVRELAACGLRIHTFGVRGRALAILAPYILSADSLAWSFDARYAKAPLPGHEKLHKRCANCPEYALRWRKARLSDAEASVARYVESRRQQPQLWEEPCLID